MADSTHISVASPPHQHEPSLSLISPNSSNTAYQSQEGDGGKSNDVCLKSSKLERDSEQCNGALHIEDDSKFSKNSKENQNLSNSMDDHEVCGHAPVRHSVGKAKCLEKVNGLTHSDHSSGDNGLLVKLLNTCCKEEDTSENHSHDSGRSSGNVCQCTDTDCEDPSCDDIGLNEKRSPEVHCDGKHNDVDMLLSELEKASINQLSNSSEHCVTSNDVINGITYVVYESEKQMPDIMRLITKDLSEPYSIYTYRYFIHNWPKLCFLAMVDKVCVGAIVCKLDLHKKMVRRGYIAMLAVDSEYRRRQIGSTLVTKAIEAMIRDDCDEVVLETEITNQGALRLYENLGFVRDKRLFRYYLNGVDALRLKLWLR